MTARLMPSTDPEWDAMLRYNDMKTWLRSTHRQLVQLNNRLILIRQHLESLINDKDNG